MAQQVERMSTLPLFDLAASAVGERMPGSAPHQKAQERLDRLANRLISAAIHRFQEVADLEEAYGAGGEPVSRDACVYLRHLYEECVMEAEHVLSRVARLEKMGHHFSEAEQLRDLHGRTSAMLNATLEDIAEGEAQVRQGKVRTSQELRNELHGQLR
jgi:hypothetical protein